MRNDERYCVRIGLALEMASVPGTPNREFWRGDIQGLRGLAVTAVVIFHIVPDFFPGGFLGVDIFFVVSGFVICGLILRRHDRGLELGFKSFIFRRIERLGPAFAATLFFGSLLLILFVPPHKQDESALTAVFALLLMANVAAAYIHADYFSAEADSNIFLHLWSLAVEEQFYLGIAFLIALGAPFMRVISSRTRVAWWTIGFSLVSFSLSLLGSSDFLNYRGEAMTGFFSPVTRAWEFGVGILAYLLAEKLGPRDSFLRALAQIFALLVLLAVFFFWKEDFNHPGWWTLVPVTATLTLILAGFGSRLANKVLANKPMSLLGNMSYSLYLWHWVVIVAVTESFGRSTMTMAVSLVFSILLAYVSWAVLENRHGLLRSK
jgi:peptidoglycan/LPS O-acetylase OafA/YrhL